MVLRSQRVDKAGRPTRRFASRVDKYCASCKGEISRGQSIAFGFKKEPIHKRKCWRVYLASIAVLYSLNAVELVVDLGVAPRTAYRVLSLAKEIQNGKY